MSDFVRAFIAVTIPVNPRLREVLAELRGLGSVVRVVLPDRLHITLKFLGSIPRHCCDDIGKVLQEVCGSEPAVELELRGLGAFPHARRPSVIWAGVKPGEPLVRMAAGLEEWLETLGFTREDRPFRPHLTLARIRHRPPRELAELLDRSAEVTYGSAVVSKVTLFESILEPGGAVHRPLIQQPLVER